MQITIGLWIIPVLLSLACGAMMLRPYRSIGQYDTGGFVRLFWFIPIGFIWAVYFCALLIFRQP